MPGSVCEARTNPRRCPQVDTVSQAHLCLRIIMRKRESERASARLPRRESKRESERASERASKRERGGEGGGAKARERVRVTVWKVPYLAL